MLFINQQNVEELVFYKPDLSKKLVDKVHLIKTWKFALKNPSLKAMGKTAIKQFLKTLTDEEKQIISNYYNKPIRVDILEDSKLKNFNFDIENAEFCLPNDYNFMDICITRNGKNLGVTLWK
jgi:ABC-type glycerol-3-phosphate transport system substrate-binding protein